MTALFLSVFSSGFVAATEEQKEYVDGSLIVKTDSPEELEKYGEVEKVVDDYYVLITENTETAKKATEELEENSAVETVIPDIKMEINSIQRADLYSWGTAATGSDHYTDWLNYVTEKGGTNNKVVVAVLDTGIDATHEVFYDGSGNSRICSEASTYAKHYGDTGLVDSDVTDDHVGSHGTSVAGIIAQATPSNVCILPIKVAEANGYVSMTGAVLALANIANVTDVYNMSFGAESSKVTSDEVKSINTVFKNVIGKNKSTIVVAAGNEGASTVDYPASSDYAIAVSALKKSGTSYAFDSSYSNYGSGIAFSMPGTAVILPASQSVSGYYYGTKSGTSFSAPHLTAAVALLRADTGNSYVGTTSFTNSNDVFQGLKANTTYLGSSSSKWDKYYGYGMVEFGKNMFTPGRISASVSTSTKSATISGYALGANKINYYALTTSTSAPSNWTSITSSSYGSSYVINFSKTVTSNGTYYLWIKDASGNTGYKKIAVSGITETQLISNGIYVISSALNSSKAFDISGGSEKNGGNVQIYDSNNTVAQKFIIRHISNNVYEIENLKSAKVLDVAGGQMKNGSNVQQYASNSTCAQRWKVTKTDSYYTFASTCNTAYVLDVSGGNAKNGANIQIYVGNSTKAQKFSLKQIVSIPTSKLFENGTYKIASKLGSNMVLDIAGGSKKNGGNLQLYTSNNSNVQKFTLTYLKDGFYKITNYNSGLALDVAGASTKNGSNVQQYKYNGTIAQQWLIVQNSDKSYSFISRCNGLYIDVAGGKIKNGANIQIYAGNSTNAQKFYPSSV